MNKADIDWIIKLGRRTSELKTGTEAAQFYSRNTLQRWSSDPNGVTIIAESNGVKAGFLLGYYMTGPNDGYINCTVIDKKHRRKGIGKMLQESALREFEQRGSAGHKCDHVFCVVGVTDKPMLNLKKQVGFEVGDKFHYVEIMLPKRAKKRR
ncbi:MAG: GNAT family N-acetyltransferase [bacterium]|nr:GNAT family N-acetyltransferase [bacterium]